VPNLDKISIPSFSFNGLVYGFGVLRLGDHLGPADVTASRAATSRAAATIRIPTIG
jgi:hypothetical protein